MEYDILILATWGKINDPKDGLFRKISDGNFIADSRNIQK